MKRWHLIIDVAECEDCNNCFLSCKDEHVDNDWPGYSLSQPRHGHRWMNILRKERGQHPLIDVAYLPMPCMHCRNAPCMSKAKEDAVYRREDGIVIIDPEKSKGQKGIVDACPYNAVWWNEKEDVPQKCTFCAHLLDVGWKEPRCVQACPTGALRIVHAEDSEMKRIIDSEKLEILYPEFKTRPRIYYKNLYRYLRCFIGGSVAFEKEGIADCAEGARVILSRNSKIIDELLTDNYGDFKFDNLEENSGKYIIVILYQDFKKKEIEVDLKKSINVGNILL